METNEQPHDGAVVDIEIRPDRTAAVWYPLAYSSIWIILVSGFFSVVFLMAEAALVSLVILACAIGIIFLNWLHLEARFKKSVFTLKGDRFIARTGGLFSDTTSELAVRNVTFVAYELPFFERILLGTGTVRVESAGSGGCEIRMFHLKEPLKALDHVLTSLRRNGFRMALGDAIQEHRVATPGIIVDIVGRLFGYIILALVFLGEFLVKAKSSDLIIVAIFGTIGLVFAALVLAVRYLDLYSRRYRLYCDGVDFEEGYFTKRRTFIPAENIADTRVEQALIGRIFGFWDVKVSCQGAGKEITFAYLSQGKRMTEGIDAAVEETRARKAKEESVRVTAKEESSPEEETVSGEVKKKIEQPKGEDAFTGDREWTGDFKQKLSRALMPAVTTFAFGVLLAVIGALIGLIIGEAGAAIGIGIATIAILGGLAALSACSLWIRAAMTTYHIGEDSVFENFEFIVKKRKEFSFDKVTSITFLRNPYDWLLGTVTVRITTIGSAEVLNMSHMVDSDDFEEHVLGKVGLHLEKALVPIIPKWTFNEFMRAPGTLISFFFFGFLFAGALAAFWAIAAEEKLSMFVITTVPIIGGVCFALLLAFFIWWNRLATGYCRLHLCSEHLMGGHGVIFRERVFVPYRCVKGLQAHYHLGTPMASFIIDISGEILMGAGQQPGEQPQPGQQPIVRSNSFAIGFIEGAEKILNGLDEIIAAPAGDREVTASLSPDVVHEVEASLSGKPHVTQLLIGRFIGSLFLGAMFGGLVCATEMFFLAAMVALTVIGSFTILSYYQVQVIRYHVEKLRVAMDWGLFWKARKTVCYRHIDFIRAHEGLFNKIFGTGDIHVHTTGSSFVELALEALPEYAPFEEELKKHY